jgi:hypothetical protein
MGDGFVEFKWRRPLQPSSKTTQLSIITPTADKMIKDSLRKRLQRLRNPCE